MGHIERKASIETLVNIAAALDVGIDSLLRDSYTPSFFKNGGFDKECTIKRLMQILEIGNEAVEALTL